MSDALVKAGQDASRNFSTSPVGAPAQTCPLKADSGGAAAGGGGSFEEHKAAAIKKIKDSDFGKTEEGKKVIKKIDDLDKDGKIVSKSMAGHVRGAWSDGQIQVAEAYSNDPDAVASELVHEATHAVNEDDFPESKKKLTIDEEMRTNTNQLDFYEEQRKTGYRDPQLEKRRDDRADGKLRDNVRKRYPGAPEHL